MIRLGIVDFDTSHVVAFTQRLNHLEASEEQWVEGAQIVMGCPGTSLMSPERVPGFTEQLKSYGVKLVDEPAEMIGQIDGVLIESVDGSVHYERAKPFLEGLRSVAGAASFGVGAAPRSGASPGDEGNSGRRTPGGERGPGPGERADRHP